LLGSGIAAIVTGSTIALAYQHHYEYNHPGGRGEPDLVGLGIACAGVPLAMIGTMLWFQTPHSSNQISLGPSGVSLAGRF
jgi:hypothetical protein